MRAADPRTPITVGRLDPPQRRLQRGYAAAVLHLLVDTSTWLDLAKRRDGQRWIRALQVLTQYDGMQLLVPSVVIDEFERNRARVEASMTASVEQRFKLIKQDLGEYGGTDYESALRVLEELAHEVPLIGAMTTRNFDDVLALLQAGYTVEVTDDERAKVVERGLNKRAPFHRSRNSVADALLIELYATSAAVADLAESPHAYVTTNSDDFSLPNGDKRQPHPDIADLFEADGSSYGLGVDGLNSILLTHFGEELRVFFEANEFEEEPRRLAEIQAAETEMFDRVWHHRSLQRELSLRAVGRDDAADYNLEIARNGRERVEATYTAPGQLGPYSDFELGMLNGKLSALRWVLGADWDFLDT
jgi:hypothetical protein